ncbi:MAG: hypothetical protein ACO2ON_01575 [Candidatus Nanopusillus sp.]
MVSDLISKKFLVFAMIWSLILGFTILRTLDMIVFSIVVTPLIGVPLVIAAIFSIIVVAHVITRVEYYYEYAINRVYILVLTIFAFAALILSLILPFLKVFIR